MTYNDIALKIIDYWVENDYDGNKNKLISEVGNINDFVYKVALVIEENYLDTTDIALCACQVEMYM